MAGSRHGDLFGDALSGAGKPGLESVRENGTDPIAGLAGHPLSARTVTDTANQRRIAASDSVRSVLFAAVGTVIVSTIINVMNAHGMIWSQYPHGLEIGATYLVMFFLWCIGVSFANRRYNSK